MDLNNQRWSDEEFFREREKVLALWPTGQDLDLDETVAYLRTLPVHKNYARAVVQAKEAGRTLVQPRGGVALVDDHIALLQSLQHQAAICACLTAQGLGDEQVGIDGAEMVIVGENGAPERSQPAGQASRRRRRCRRRGRAA